MRWTRIRWAMVAMLALGLVSGCEGDREGDAPADPAAAEADEPADSGGGEADGEADGPGDAEVDEPSDAEAADEGGLPDGDEAPEGGAAAEDTKPAPESEHRSADEGGSEAAASFLESIGAVRAQVAYAAEQLDGSAAHITYAFDPPSTAIRIVADDEEMRLIMTEGEAPIDCRLEGSEWHCAAYPQDDEAAHGPRGPLGFPLGSGPFFLSADESGLVATGSETIAGRDAECFEAPPEDGDERPTAEMTMCADVELGVMVRLREEGADGQTVGYEAVEVREAPDPALFDPPAEPALGD